MALRRTQSGIVGAAAIVDLRDRLRLEIPQFDVYGPVCDICNQVVDSEQIVEGYPGWCEPIHGGLTHEADSETCKVLVRHHGAEELHTFDFESRNWSAEDLRRRMQQRRWFSPLEGGAVERPFSAGGV